MLRFLSTGVELGAVYRRPPIALFVAGHASSPFWRADIVKTSMSLDRPAVLDFHEWADEEKKTLLQYGGKERYEGFPMFGMPPWGGVTWKLEAFSDVDPSLGFVWTPTTLSEQFPSKRREFVQEIDPIVEKHGTSNSDLIFTVSGMNPYEWVVVPRVSVELPNYQKAMKALPLVCLGDGAPWDQFEHHAASGKVGHVLWALFRVLPHLDNPNDRSHAVWCYRRILHHHLATSHHTAHVKVPSITFTLSPFLRYVVKSYQNMLYKEAHWNEAAVVEGLLARGTFLV